MQTDLIIIACSIFRYELEFLQSQDRIDIPVVYIDSMLHMNPKKLQELLDARLKEYEHCKIILLFGDCHARMLDYEANTNVVRAQGINCCEIFLGLTEYNRLRKDGAFILLPEWSVRWKEAFVGYMGFENAKSTSVFMNDMHKKLVYVDTGFREINQPLLAEIAEYFSLPLEVHHVSLSVLEKALTLMIDKQRNACLNDR